MKKSRRTFMREAGLIGGALATAGATEVTALAQGPAGGGAGPAARLSKPQKLRILLKKPGLLMAPEGYNIPAARLAEAVGFEAIYIGGWMISETYLGVPDYGVITPTHLIEIAGPIARSVSIPAIVDGDQAGENALNVYHTVPEYEKAGFAAMHIEDTLNPKHADQRGRPAQLQSIERMILRLRVAIEARTDPDFVLIARSDTPDLEDCIRRGRAYAKAGADIFMLAGGRRTPAEIDRIAEEVGIPLLGINLPAPDYVKSKLKVNIYANLVSSPAMAFAHDILRELKDNNEIKPRPALSAEMTDRIKGLTKYAELSEKWTATP